MQTITINPSDFTLLWGECPRCFYLKVKNRFFRPKTPFPGVFTNITASVKRGISNIDLSTINDTFPSGEIVGINHDAIGKPMATKDKTLEITLKGLVDLVIALDNNEHAIAKILTADLKDEVITEDYWLQMHSLLRAVEHPGFGGYSVKNVTKIGVIVINPAEFSLENGMKINLRWVEIPIERKEYLEYLKEVVTVLNADLDQVSAGDECEFCRYRNR